LKDFDAVGCGTSKEDRRVVEGLIPPVLPHEDGSPKVTRRGGETLDHSSACAGNAWMIGVKGRQRLDIIRRRNGIGVESGENVAACCRSDSGSQISRYGEPVFFR
jgi:hypothetical protein